MTMKNLFTKLISIIFTPIKCILGLFTLVFFALTLPIFVIAMAIVIILGLLYKKLYLSLFEVPKPTSNTQRDYVDAK